MNVFAKNTTVSPITVAGYTVHYIDSTDAELVEVEGSGGGATSSDDATGTISGVTLPTAHSYTGVSFDSLRYYVKGTLSNTWSASGSNYYGQSASDTWYYGTITWTDESIGDLSGKIITNPPSSNTMVQQSTIRVHVITTDTGISGWHAYDTLDSSVDNGTGQISEYTYANGVHSITFWLRMAWLAWLTDSCRIMIRYLDGTTTFTGLNAFDLVNVSDGALSKATTTDRYDMYDEWGGDITVHAVYAGTVKYNAFKFTLNNTPYYYVIDGTHDTWTDDLSAWGYSEVQPVVELPEVVLVGDSTQDYWLYPSSSLSGSVTIAANGTHELYQSSGTLPGYSSYPQAMIVYQSTSGTNAGYTGFEPTQVPYGSVNVYGCKNISGGSLTLARIKIARCYSLSATVVTVYNSSNVAYNAFKYTANNTDYYYVLDGTQTDWVSDLSSIGYHDYLEITLYMPGGSSNTYYAQGGITSSYSGSPNNSYLHTVYSDSNLTTPATYDATKRYERGSYNDGVWTPSAIQGLSDMPSSTSSESTVISFILYNDSGMAKLWFVSNYPSSGGASVRFASDPVGFTFRVYTVS